MGFVAKWSADVKDGAMSAIFDHGLTARRAWELAKTGELPQTKPGEPRAGAVPGLPLATVQDWARHERVRRGAIATAAARPDVVLTNVIGQMVAVLERETKRAVQLSNRGKLARGELTKLARDAREIAALQRAVQTGASEPRSNGDKPAAREPGWLERLAASPDSTH